MTDLPRFAAPVAEEADGRRRRSAANRRRIIAAMLLLLKEGEHEPSADMIATRAGVGRRTVFRLFSDMESIYREMNEEMRARIAPLRAIPVEGRTVADRLKALASRRARLFEEVLPIEEAAARIRHRSPTLMAQHVATEAELRAIVEDQLPPDLRADRGLVDSIDLLLSIDVWRRLRRERGMSADAALALLQRMLIAQLRPSLA